MKNIAVVETLLLFGTFKPLAGAIKQPYSMAIMTVNS